jgi:hypothetical protein
MTMAGTPARWLGAGGRAKWMVVASGWLVLLAGCGLAANPQPPTLWLPEPVKDLAATRVGDEVHLHWTMPKNTTDKVLLKGDQRAHVCWEVPPAGAGAANPASHTPGAPGAGTTALQEKPGARASAAQVGQESGAEKPAANATPQPAFDAKGCKAAGDALLPPNKPADFTAKMPAELTAGIPRAVAFYVELQNHAGKTAGPSNAAWVATGAAPPAVTGLRLETRAEGVVVRWTAAAPEAGMVLRMHRTLIQKTGAQIAGAQTAAPRPNEAQGVPPPEQQVLEVDLDKSDHGEALDHDAALDQTWKYSVERVLKVESGGHALEIAGPSSDPVTIDAKDVFPPAVPAGLAAVVDEQAKAIDLSWTPDTDADLAGYFVYRRDETAGTGWERMTPKAVAPPSCSDATVVAGHKYAYAVSAVDQDGNESGKSGEVEAELTP